MGSSFWDAQRANKTKSMLLVLLVVPMVAGLVWFAGWMFNGGEWILPFAILVSILYAAGGYYWGDGIVLAVHGARAADPQKDAYLFNTVEGLALAAQIPKPKLYIIQDPSPNAFATGRDPQHASIAVTSGLCQMMNRQELEGVLAHEMSHIKNFDSRFMTLVIVLVGLVAILANMIGRGMWLGGGRREERGGSGMLAIVGLLLVIFAPLLSRLVQLAISRSREYLADASAAQLTRNPDGLASALEKLKGTPPLQTASDTTAGLFISDPVHGGDKKRGIGERVMGLFATHPPLDERIKALRAM